MKLLSHTEILPFLPGVAAFSPGRLLGLASLHDVVGNNTEYEALIRKGLSEPTASRSVKFSPFKGDWESLRKDSVLRNSEWTWRINTSEIAVPNNDGPGYKLQDPHVVGTSYDLSWPKGTNLSDALDGAKGTFCATTLASFNLPVSVLNKYTEEHAGADCMPLLGEECVKSLLSTKEGAVWVTNENGGQCISPAKAWSEIPSCRDSLGAMKDYGLLYSGWPLDGRNPRNNATADKPWEAGNEFYVNVSSAVNGTASDTYLWSVNQLHILMLDARVPLGPRQRRLLCARVNATKLPENDGDKDGVARLGENIRGSSSGVERLGYSAGVLVLTLTVALASIVM
ncbi:hypothetical protein PG999_012230 [Apiospora kogelbergensis]|uniref:Major paralogous domain-containing protein n=1 Tax=Apiospora kogelbergensis TaxID=1337665 RepID=A0AAW0QQZ9_9PEZI